MKRMRGFQKTGAFLLVVMVMGIGDWAVSETDKPEAASGSNNPKIVLLYTVVDLGTVQQGKQAVALFPFRNTGNSTLIIDPVTASNQHISFDVSHTALKPGEDGTIKVLVDTVRLVGRIAEKFTLYCNDPESPEVPLEISGTIQPLLALESALVFAGQVAKDVSFSRTVGLKGTLIDEGKTVSLSVHADSPTTHVKILKKRQKDKIVPYVHFVLMPEMKAGTFNETITVVSKDPPAQVRLLVAGQKLGVIRVTPDRFAFFVAEHGDPGPRTILFECEKPFTITKVDNLTGIIDISVQTLEPGTRYQLTATLHKNMAGESFLGVVKIHTDLEEHPLIHVPVISGKKQ